MTHGDLVVLLCCVVLLLGIGLLAIKGGDDFDDWYNGTA